MNCPYCTFKISFLDNKILVPGRGTYHAECYKFSEAEERLHRLVVSAENEIESAKREWSRLLHSYREENLETRAELFKQKIKLDRLVKDLNMEW
jgi:hypothetical protein